MCVQKMWVECPNMEYCINIGDFQLCKHYHYGERSNSEAPGDLCDTGGDITQCAVCRDWECSYYPDMECAK